MLAHVGAPVVLDPLQLLPAITFGVLYAIRVRSLRGSDRAVPGWRQACWWSGLALIAGSLSSPLGHMAEDLFAAHMAEHLLIADLGALLLVLGVTGPLIAPLLRNPLLGPLRHLAHPIPAFGLWALDLYAWHVVAPHEAAVNHDAVHAIQHMLFVGLGVNMWMALFGPLPKPTWFGNGAKLAYILAVRMVGTILANVFVWATGPFYDVYAPGEWDFDVSARSDQVAAGSIMMVEGSILTICLFGWLFVKAAKEGEEKQELLDLASASGVELEPKRAARAVAAGRGEDLRRRIEAAEPGAVP